MMDDDNDSDPSPCITERLNKLLDFTPANRDSPNIRAKCKAFWDHVENSPTLQNMMVDADAEPMGTIDTCKSAVESPREQRPWTKTFALFQEKGLDKAALAADDSCRLCSLECKMEPLPPVPPATALQELPVECRSDLFIIDPYRVDRIITTPKVLEPNMYIDQWAIRQQAKQKEREIEQSLTSNDSEEEEQEKDEY